MLVWINVGRNPVDRVLAATGAKEQVTAACSRGPGCAGVEFSRSLTWLYPLESIRCLVKVRGNSEATALVTKALDDAIPGYERRFFVVVRSERGGSS